MANDYEATVASPLEDDEEEQAPKRKAADGEEIELPPVTLREQPRTVGTPLDYAGTGLPPVVASPMATSIPAPTGTPSASGRDYSGAAEHPRVASPLAVPNQDPFAEYHAAVARPSGVQRVAQNHPILGGILKGLDVAGTILAPGEMLAIPGTTLHHQLDVKRALNRGKQAELENEEAIKQGQAELQGEETQARTAETQARTRALENPPPKTGLTPEEQFMNDALHGGPNGGPKVDENGKPYNYLSAHQAWKQSEQDTRPEKPDTETQEAQRYEGIQTKLQMKQPVSPEDLAWAKSYEKRKTLAPAATVALNAPKVRDERSDKSFQYNNQALDKVSTPIDALNQRMGRLMDSINQDTPQADSLVAPELLSVMSGGQGSGLRMNEAEIARIVGGRSNWESLQAAVNKWKTDPKEALSITPEQRREIRALAKTVQDKLIAKEKILDDARNDLIDADDPKEHRRIVADAKKKLDAIDSGETNVSGGEGGGKPIGAGKISFTPLPQ